MWVVITSTKHIKVKTLEEAIELLTQKARETSPEKVRLITLKEYNNWEGRKRKRGKKAI
jgi:hypothetical protein